MPCVAAYGQGADNEAGPILRARWANADARQRLAVVRVGPGRRSGQKMRICLISMHYAEYAVSLAGALAADHRVLLVLRDDNVRAELGDPALLARGEALQIMLVKHSPSRDPRWIGNCAKLLRAVGKFRPDVVHLQESYEDYLGLSLPWLRRYPLVLTIHDPVPHAGKDTRMSGRARLWRSMHRRLCGRALAHGHYVEQEVVRHYPRLAGRVRSVPHGPLGMSAGAADGWEPGNILFFGRMEAYKGLRYLVQAVEALKREGLQFKVVVAGRGTDLEHYRDLLQSDVTFELRERYISREELDSLMKRANILVMPYTDATQSGVAALALRYGRPVVASRVGSVPEMVQDGLNGRLVPPKNASALADAIKELLGDEGKCKTMAANACRLASGEFSWQAIAARTVAVYSELLETSDD